MSRLFTLPHAATTDDWYTPAWIFEAMDETFDLDVASPPGGIPWLPCRRYYSLEDDGLAQPWEGFVWCNPPFSAPASKRSAAPPFRLVQQGPTHRHKSRYFNFRTHVPVAVCERPRRVKGRRQLFICAVRYWRPGRRCSSSAFRSRRCPSAAGGVMKVWRWTCKTHVGLGLLTLQNGNLSPLECSPLVEIAYPDDGPCFFHGTPVLHMFPSRSVPGPPTTPSPRLGTPPTAGGASGEAGTLTTPRVPATRHTFRNG